MTHNTIASSARTRTVAERQRTHSVTGALLCAALFLFVILVSLLFLSHQRNSAPDPALTAEDTLLQSAALDSTAASLEPIRTEALEEEAVGPPAPLREPENIRIPVDNGDVHRGDLILINIDHPYVFPESQPQTVLYGNKSPTYMLSTIAISLNTELFPIFDRFLSDFAEATGCREVLVTSGYRTYEFQEELYNSRVASQGAEMAALYVALPGHSEHHAGLAIDMVIFTDGRQYYFSEYDKASWIIENAPEYGFFQRYTEDKQPITRCAPEPWHYRYVGTPHARLITDSGMCFEEYHDYLHTFTWDGERLLVAADGTISATDGYDLPAQGYMIYTVPAEEGDVTQIPLPPDLPYSVSGDNDHGFIVTVSLG